MPTNQPSNAPDDGVPDDARDDRTAAAVLSDEQLDDAPGGGGLGGAPENLGGAVGSARASGGAAPNAPLADAMAAGDSDADAEHEARTRMAGDATATQRTSP